DLFHDTDAALAASWAADRGMLTASGFDLSVVRDSSSFVEAIVTSEEGSCVLEWARDSAFRFFPLIEDGTLGLSLHPFDLATNKVLALAGRLEPRDWVDVLTCDERLQPLGYLAYAACGKDPGYNPISLLAVAKRQRYSRAELASLDFDGETPDAQELGRRWHTILAAADRICETLPADHVGTCVATRNGELCRTDGEALEHALAEGALVFHEGSIGGAWPRIVT
ncbi:MAG: hypothetical protein ACOC2D_12335, partial [Spirochaetota bacterium]